MARAVPPERMLDFLLDVPMFGDLDEIELVDLSTRFEVHDFPGGSWVFREGDPGDAWYVVYEGEVEVVKEIAAGEITDGGTGQPPRGTVRVIAVLGTRACFGEMAILDGSRRSASVRTTRDSVVLKFPRPAFSELIAKGSLGAYKLVHQMALILVSRQRRTTHRLVELMNVAEGAARDGILPLLDQSTVAE